MHKHVENMWKAAGTGDEDAIHYLVNRGWTWEADGSGVFIDGMIEEDANQWPECR